MKKMKLKIYLPQNTGLNYIGMIIGPKGIYLNKLKEETNCQIIIKGRGTIRPGVET